MAESKCADDNILEFITSYHDKHGWAPTVREIAEGVGLSSSSTVHARLKKLDKNKRIIYKGIRQIKVV